MRHVPLLLAVLVTVLGGSRLVHSPAPPADTPQLAATRAGSPARLDGRVPDGAPAGAVEPTATVHSALTLDREATPEPAEVSTRTSEAASEPPPAPPATTPEPAVPDAPQTQGSDTPAAVPVEPAPAPPAPEPVVQATAAPPYATAADIEAALAQTAWPAELWGRVIAIAFCESGVDTDRDGYYDAANTQAVGGGGLYIGTLQIGVSHRFSQPYDLYTLVGNLAAGYELWARAGGSFAPWGCR